MGAVGVRLSSTGCLIQAHKGSAPSHAPLFHPLALAAGPPLSTFVVVSNLGNDLNYGGRVGFFLYRPNALLIKHCSQLVMSKGRYCTPPSLGRERRQDRGTLLKNRAGV